MSDHRQNNATPAPPPRFALDAAGCVAEDLTCLKCGYKVRKVDWLGLADHSNAEPASRFHPCGADVLSIRINEEERAHPSVCGTTERNVELITIDIRAGTPSQHDD